MKADGDINRRKPGCEAAGAAVPERPRCSAARYGSNVQVKYVPTLLRLRVVLRQTASHVIRVFGCRASTTARVPAQRCCERTARVMRLTASVVARQRV